MIRPEWANDNTRRQNGKCALPPGRTVALRRAGQPRPIGPSSLSVPAQSSTHSGGIRNCHRKRRSRHWPRLRHQRRPYVDKQRRLTGALSAYDEVKMRVGVVSRAGKRSQCARSWPTRTMSAPISRLPRRPQPGPACPARNSRPFGSARSLACFCGQLGVNATSPEYSLHPWAADKRRATETPCSCPIYRGRTLAPARTLAARTDCSNSN